MNKLKKKPILLFVLALVALYIVIYIIPRLTGALVSSYTIEYGELTTADETTAYLVRNEKVYTAQTGGEANRYIGEHTLIRGGTTVMEVNGSAEGEPAAAFGEVLTRLGKNGVSTADFTAKDSGIVSYYADGYEGRLRPDNMKKGDYSYYSKLNQDDVVSLERDKILPGEPVFKVVDRTKWYMVCYIDASHMDRYEEGDEILVEFADDTVRADIHQVKKEGNRARIILETVYYYEKFAQTRAAEVALITCRQKGLIIDNDSIAEENKQQGVYVRNKSGEFVFVPIKVLATNGSESLVADTTYEDEVAGKTVSTVEIYDEILKNPN